MQKTIGFVAFTFAALAAQAASALDRKPVLNLKAAQVMAEACMAHQVATKYKPIQVVIVDDGGHVIHLSRQDGACKACEQIATDKARTAAMFNNSTRGFETLSYGPKKDGVGAELPGIALMPRMIAFPGGLPIVINGVPVGGIGVSGASGDEDEQCAQAGIDAAKNLLK